MRPHGRFVLHAAIRAGVLRLRRRLESVISIFGRAYRRRFSVVAATDDVVDSADDPSGLLEGYLVGELSADDRARFEQWVAMDDERSAIVAALRDRGTRQVDARPHDQLVDVEGWWAECGASMRAPEGQHLALVRELPTESDLRIGMAPISTTRWWRSRATWAGVAASLVCATLGVWAMHVRRSETAVAARAVEHEYVTARGERAIVTLDGARVVLGPESVLRVADGYGRRDRAVSLVGHAFFDIVPDPGRPFRVSAGGVVAQDIGTRFDVRAYASDSTTRVVVAEGTVAVRARMAQPRVGGSAAPSVIVTRGMMAVAGTDGALRLRSGVAVDRYVSWSDGRLTFEDTPLAEAAAELGRWYDLDIRLGDARLRSKRLTASFDDPVAATLVALEEALGVRAVRVGRVVTLYPP
jgi:ferric-dicitrate binding protein FerR (iron transport regulator)